MLMGCVFTMPLRTCYVHRLENTYSRGLLRCSFNYSGQCEKPQNAERVTVRVPRPFPSKIII